MDIGIIFILIIGAGLPILSFLTALYYVKKNQGREDRINRVVTKMIDGPRDTTSPLHRMIMSGVLELENGNEIVEACYRIEAKGEINPIPNNCGLSSEDLKPFFAYVSENKIDLNNTPIQEVIEIYKNKMTLTPAA